MFSAALPDALLYFAITATMLLSSREFRLHNLAAGTLVILGGWLGHLLTTLFSGGAWQHCFHNPWLVLLLLLPPFVSILAPLVLVSRFEKNPLLFLFVTLGQAMITLGIADPFVMKEPNAVIPAEWSKRESTILAVIAAVAALAVTLIVWKSARWAKYALWYRCRPRDTAHFLARLVGLQTLVLLVIGALTQTQHHGLWNTAEDRTIVCLICLFLCASRPILAPLAAFIAGSSLHWLDSSGIIPSGLSNGTLSVIMCAVLLARYALGIYAPHLRIILARTVTPVPIRQTAAGGQLILLGAASLFVIFAGMTLFAFGGIQVDPPIRLCFLLTLVVCAWLSIRQLGVYSVSWPLLSCLPIYLFAWLDRGGHALMISAISVLLLLLLQSAYLLILRILPLETALTIDLGLCLGVTEILRSSTSISGSDSVISLDFLHMYPIPHWAIFVAILSLSFLTLCTALAWSNSGQRRALILSASSFEAGVRNGRKPARDFVLIAFLLLLVAFLANVLFRFSKDAVSTNELSLDNGLVAMVFGFLCYRLGFAMGLSFYVVSFIVQTTFFVGKGMVEIAISGGFFVFTCYASRLFEENRNG